MAPDPVIPEPPSLTSAVERVLSASQQLFVDRLDLLLLEAKEGLVRGVQAAALAAIAVGAFFCGWFCINASLAVLFRPTVPLPGILAVLAGVNLGAGILAIAAARQLAMPLAGSEAGPLPSQPSQGSA